MGMGGLASDLTSDGWAWVGSSPVSFGSGYPWVFLQMPFRALEWGHLLQDCRASSSKGQECFTCGKRVHHHWECPNDRGPTISERQHVREQDESCDRECRVRDETRRTEDRAVEEALRDFMRDVSRGPCSAGSSPCQILFWWAPLRKV